MSAPQFALLLRGRVGYQKDRYSERNGRVRDTIDLQIESHRHAQQIVERLKPAARSAE